MADPATAAFAACERVADECRGATGSGPYADGFRAAAGRMKQEIARLSAGRPRTALERDLHDVEVESRTLARVVRAAERVVVGLDVHDGAAGAVRALLAVFFDPGELPAALRPAVDEPSETRLIDAPEEDVAGG